MAPPGLLRRPSVFGAGGEVLKLPRALHDAIAADADGVWAAFRRDFDGALFVDLKRQLVRSPQAA